MVIILVLRYMDEALKLWIVVARAHAALARHAQKHAAEHGLTAAEFGVLEALYHRGPMRLGELQGKILVTSGGMTYVVKRLEDRGLVRRERSASDARAKYAALTAAGTRLIERIFPEHEARMVEALAGLSRAEQREATRLVRQLGLYAAEVAGEDMGDE